MSFRRLARGWREARIDVILSPGIQGAVEDGGRRVRHRGGMTGSSQEGRAPTGAGSAAGRGAGLLVRSRGEVTAPAAAGPVPDAYARSPESVLEALGVSAGGLTSEGAARRLREFGPHQIQALEPARAVRALLRPLRPRGGTLG